MTGLMTSSISPSVPVANTPLSSSPIRSQFQAAISDVNNIYSILGVGSNNKPIINTTMYIDATSPTYGAVADWVWNYTTHTGTGTDNTAAINNAIIAAAAAGTKNVYIPDSCYALGPINMLQGVNIIGAPTVLNYSYLGAQWPNDTVRPTLVLGSGGIVLPNSGCGFFNLNIEANLSGLSIGTAQTYNCFTANAGGSTALYLQNVGIRGFNYGIGDPNNQMFVQGVAVQCVNNNYGINGRLPDARFSGNTVFAANYLTNVYINGYSSSAQFDPSTRNEFSGGAGLVLDGATNVEYYGEIDAAWTAGLVVKGQATRYNKVSVIFKRSGYGKTPTVEGTCTHVYLDMQYSPLELDLSGSHMYNGTQDGGSGINTLGAVPLNGIEIASAYNNNQNNVCWMGGNATNATPIYSLATTAAQSSGTSLTTASTAGLLIGMNATNLTTTSSIPAGTTIQSIPDATHFVVNNTCTGVLNGDNLQFTGNFIKLNGGSISNWQLVVTGQTQLGLTVLPSPLQVDKYGLYYYYTTFVSDTGHPNSGTILTGTHSSTVVTGINTVSQYSTQVDTYKVLITCRDGSPAHYNLGFIVSLADESSASFQAEQLFAAGNITYNGAGGINVTIAAVTTSSFTVQIANATGVTITADVRVTPF